jgi:hypothetical protein
MSAVLARLTLAVSHLVLTLREPTVDAGALGRDTTLELLA